MSQTVLLGKLREVAQEIPFIEKRGRNDHHNYDFTQSVDVVREIREKLLSRNVIVVPGASNARHLAYGSKGGHLTTVDLRYRFTDVETGCEVDVPWVGVGADTGGDKGIYKAYTGGLKYALLGLFLIPTSNDPERDDLTSKGEDERHKDDARPAAPPIPVDRAKSILEAAVGVGMATITPSADGSNIVGFHPVFQAVLSQHGVEKIGHLNVDQAEAVERFLEMEKGNV